VAAIVLICSFGRTQQTGRRPTRKATEQNEKSLGIWLHRFTCNDDGVKDRAQASLTPDEFNYLVTTITQAPDAKQVRARACFACAPVPACTARSLVALMLMY
jgi:hypothetical protein